MPPAHDPLAPSPTPWAELFPSPAQILALPDRTAALRGAGLSGRKVDYVVALAEKFESGELSSKILVESSDEELEDRLLSLPGVGPWTVSRTRSSRPITLRGI